MVAFHLFALGLLGLARAAADCSLTGQQIENDLHGQLSAGTELVLTTDAAYAKDFTPRFAVTAPPTYSVGVKPALVSDVQKVVRYAQSKRVPFLATGGGHGYTFSLGGLSGGIDLDLGNFNTIEIDSKANTLLVGGSVRSSQIAAALQAAGYEIPMGECSCIGYNGAALGGGVGPYSGIHGPMSDSLLSVEFVTGSGQILNVSKTSYPDLFYGLKGAGFNYGVATHLKYNIYPATNGGQAMNADMVFPGVLNGTIFQLANSFVGKQPKELSITLAVAYDAKAGITIIANFVYAGPQADGIKLIQPFLNLQPLTQNISTIAWKDIPNSVLFGATTAGCNPGAQYVPFAINLYEVNVTNIVSVINYMDSAMGANPLLQTLILSWAQYSQFGLQRFPDSSSAFPFRQAVSFLQIDGFATNATQVPALTTFGKDLRDRFLVGSGRSSLEVYVHFAHGDESATNWYTAAKLPQLKLLKAKYDPSNLFSHYNSITKA